MKRIYFNNLSGWRNGILFILGMTCFLVGSFDLFLRDYSAWNNRIFKAGSFFLFVFFLKSLYGRYYVGWNKLGMNIRIKSFLSSSFRFKDVTSINIHNDILTICRKGSRKNIELDVSTVKTQDVDRLTQIIKKHTITATM